MNTRTPGLPARATAIIVAAGRALAQACAYDLRTLLAEFGQVPERDRYLGREMESGFSKAIGSAEKLTAIEPLYWT